MEIAAVFASLRHVGEKWRVTTNLVAIRQLYLVHDIA
jgi:hypothetical protein